MSSAGRVTLEPSFFVPGGASSRDAMPDADVMLRVEALDANGQLLASAIAPAPRADHDAEALTRLRLVLPLSAAQHEQLATVRAYDVRAPVGGAHVA
jgi:hypothetical protein